MLEFDGWQAHGHRHAFERDRKRDQVMLANGLRPMRVTDRHLKHEPVALVARIAQALRSLNRYSNAATVARITNEATSATPSNTVASPSPVICQTMIAVPSSAPM